MNHHRDETNLDTFLPIGESFLHIVGAMCPVVLGKIVWRELEADPRQTEPRTWEGIRDV